MRAFVRRQRVVLAAAGALVVALVAVLVAFAGGGSAHAPQRPRYADYLTTPATSTACSVPANDRTGGWVCP